MAVEFDTGGHEFGLVDFENNGLKADERLDHMSLDFFDFDFRVILDDEFDFLFFFLFDLNQVIVPDETETLDDFIGLSGKAGEDFLKDINNIIVINFLKFVGQFGKVQCDIIIELVILLDMKERIKEVLFHGVCKQEEDLVGG